MLLQIACCNFLLVLGYLMEKGHGKGNNIKNQRSEAKGKGKQKCYKGTKYDHNSWVRSSQISK